MLMAYFDSPCCSPVNAILVKIKEKGCHTICFKMSKIIFISVHNMKPFFWLKCPNSLANLKSELCVIGPRIRENGHQIKF